MCFKLLDQVIEYLNSRFDNDFSRVFKSLDAFTIGQLTDVVTIIEFYQDD